uniref:Uncharacterized protein n=1 Tax=Rhizochromulina marina TaxID=1034831 RepID=A0A7S2RQE4_9STRA
MARLEEKDKVVAVLMEKRRKEAEKRNQEQKQKAIARLKKVRDANVHIQAEKQRRYDERQTQAFQRLLHREEEEKERLEAERQAREAKERKRQEAYKTFAKIRKDRAARIMQEMRRKEERNAELVQRQELEHRRLVNSREVEEWEVRDNLERFHRVEEEIRRCQAAVYSAEDKRVAAIKESQDQIVRKRIMAAHHAAISKHFVREKLEQMRATQNFKGIKKLTDFAASSRLEKDTTDGGGGSKQPKKVQRNQPREAHHDGE